MNYIVFSNLRESLTEIGMGDLLLFSTFNFLKSRTSRIQFEVVNFFFNCFFVFCIFVIFFWYSLAIGVPWFAQNLDAVIAVTGESSVWLNLLSLLLVAFTLAARGPVSQRVVIAENEATVISCVRCCHAHRAHSLIRSHSHSYVHRHRVHRVDALHRVW